MSAPFKMNADQAEQLARFLRMLNAATVETGCTLQPYGMGAIQLPLGDPSQPTSLEFVWDDEATEYRIDDRNGS